VTRTSRGRRLRGGWGTVVVWGGIVVVVVLFGLGSFGGGGDEPFVFEPDDAGTLVKALAAATEAQGVCYGWVVDVTDPDGGSFSDSGSSLGAGRRVDPAACPKAVVLTVEVDYTSESSELPDSATSAVAGSGLELNVDPALALGLPASALVELDDVAIGNAIMALPQFVADAKLAPPVTAVTSAGQLPSDARLTGSPGSDTVRRAWPMLVLCAVLALVGAVWLVATLRSKPGRPSRPAVHRTRPGPPAGGG
jgi:hypothetical protein